MWDGIKRRKGDNVDTFTPNTAFEGYVTRALEDMTKGLLSIKTDLKDGLSALPCKTQDERIRETEQKVSKIEGKASIYGAIMGFLSGIITNKFMGK